jgi:hypothetical protein
MEQIIQSIQAVHLELAGLAWGALGLLLPLGLVLAVVVLRWVYQGGLRSGGTREFFAREKEIAHWLSLDKNSRT